MNETTAEALSSVLDDLEHFEIDLNAYYDDLEPQSIIDTVLNSKINSLRAFCQSLGWHDLSRTMEPLVPLRGTAVESLEVIQSFVVPEARRLLSSTEVGEKPDSITWFWQFIHPRIAQIAQSRFDSGFFADAVEASLKEVNDSVKQIVRNTNGLELDGASLMTTAFSVQKPLIRLNKLQTRTDQDIQRDICK